MILQNIWMTIVGYVLINTFAIKYLIIFFL